MPRFLLSTLAVSILIATAPAAPARSAVPSPQSAPARPEYVATISRLPDGLRAWMNGVSWRPGCPVPLRKLG